MYVIIRTRAQNGDMESKMDAIVAISCKKTICMCVRVYVRALV